MRGDILILSSGDAVPADARLVEASTIAAAEAALTGESLPVFKSIGKLVENTPMADRPNMAFTGTHVTAGRCLAVVTASGVKNEIGKIAHHADFARRLVEAQASAFFELHCS